VTTSDSRGPYSSRPYNPAAVNGALAGEHAYLRPADRHEVIRRMIGCRWSAKKIAAYLGINVRTVSRVAKKQLEDNARRGAV
jgi:DNA-binding NarL/FixJ family response regulator